MTKTLFFYILVIVAFFVGGNFAVLRVFGTVYISAFCTFTDTPDIYWIDEKAQLGRLTQREFWGNDYERFGTWR